MPTYDENGALLINIGAGAAPTNAQYVVMALDGVLTDERVLTGTANQVIVTDGGAGGPATLSTPQDIHTGASPTFADVFVPDGGTFGIAGNELLRFDAAGYAIFDGCAVGVGKTPNPAYALDVLGIIEAYNDGVDVYILIHEDAGTHDTYTRYRRGAIDWYTGMIGGTDYTIDYEGAAMVTVEAVTGNVGIGTPTPGEKATILSADNVTATNIVNILANNLTHGVGIGFNAIRKTGTAVNTILTIDAKGTGDLLLQTVATGNIGFGALTPGSLTEWNFATEDLEFVDAGSAGATEQDWIEVQVGGVTGYIRVFAAK